MHSSSEIKPFTFDAVIDNSLTQRQMYDRVFQSLVNSVVEGFNGTIFSYGQTGTGKTFTMEGSLESEANYGVMPNAFKQIFDQVSLNREKRYLIGVSYFEIYQEEIRDLLDCDNFKKCVIHENPNGGVHIKGLSSYLCSSFQEIVDLLAKGKLSRVVGATNMNEHSSRSHAIFQVTIETSDQTDIDGEHIKVGKLNLVDLAGSERVSKTGAEGMRLKEAGKINLSLSTLGNVISALVDGAAFIPYRDSKLTRILQDGIGGNSRTVMVATVGPAGYNYEETINTLRYASRAKNIENKPRINENPKDAMLRTYQEEINRLRSMVQDKMARKTSATKPTTAEDFDDNLEKETTRSSKPKPKSTTSNGYYKQQKGLMDTSTINELREMLEPLGIVFDGDIEAILVKLKEKTESLQKDTQMVKEDHEKLSTQLQKATDKLKSAKYECNNLTAQIKWLESKVLNSSGENKLIEKTKSQKEQIELQAKTLESHKMRQEHLRKVLAEKEMTNEESFADCNALENDYRVKVEKLMKLTRKIDTFETDYAMDKKKNVENVTRLKNCILEMKKCIPIYIFINDSLQFLSNPKVVKNFF
ncbi:kinesin-II 95 kDa subunit [Folsomia candida]|uniref:kinesin-II 95 kDa subunit n=1 Tax=Folsomia candida TaxID=158441 RepID=UPI001604E602|nr:kinesin-II 95 kDa subunit [Folsomia candida]